MQKIESSINSVKPIINEIEKEHFICNLYDKIKEQIEINMDSLTKEYKANQIFPFQNSPLLPPILSFQFNYSPISSYPILPNDKVNK